MLLRDKNIAEATEVAKRIAQAFPENTEVAVFLKTRSVPVEVAASAALTGRVPRERSE